MYKLFFTNVIIKEKRKKGIYYYVPSQIEDMQLLSETFMYNRFMHMFT